MTRPVTELARDRRAARPRRPHGPGRARPARTRCARSARRSTGWRRASSELLAHEREAVADLSHRLRTPVTALRLDVESLPRRARAGTGSTADVDELTRQIDALIREARRPVREGVEARCDARAVVAERVEFWAALAEDQGRAVALTLPAGPSPVRAGADGPRGGPGRAARQRPVAHAGRHGAGRVADAGTRGIVAAGDRRRGPGLRRLRRAGAGRQPGRVDRAGAGHRPAYGGRLRRRPDDRAQPRAAAPGSRCGSARRPARREAGQKGSSGSIATKRNSSVR